MLALCLIAHLQTDSLPTCGKASEPEVITEYVDFVVGLARLSDKYDCANAMKLAGKVLLRQFFDTQKATFQHWGMLLLAAYLFEDSYAFQKITGRLILGWTGPMFSLQTQYDPDERMPSSVFSKINYLPSVIGRMSNLTVCSSPHNRQGRSSRVAIS